MTRRTHAFDDSGLAENHRPSVEPVARRFLRGGAKTVAWLDPACIGVSSICLATAPVSIRLARPASQFGEAPRQRFPLVACQSKTPEHSQATSRKPIVRRN